MDSVRKEIKTTVFQMGMLDMKTIVKKIKNAFWWLHQHGQVNNQWTWTQVIRNFQNLYTTRKKKEAREENPRTMG